VNWPRGKIENLVSRRGWELKRDFALAVEVGSTMHGIAIEGTDDYDMTLVRLEGWHEFVNGPEKKQSVMIRTQPEGYRSRVGDSDLNVYTLRKFAGLLAKGNPSILAVMYSPNRWTGRYGWLDWEQLMKYTTSLRAGDSFLGYMRQQIERWTGQRGQRGVNRPELVEKYGYDTKYAGHAIRLGLQGQEYLRTGKIQLPMREEARELILGVRTGEYDEADALNLATLAEANLKRAYDESTLPRFANLDGVSMWLEENYGEHFALEGYVPN